MNYISQLDELTKDYESAFGQLTLPELNTKENAKSWSINQIIEHVTLLNKSYFAIFEEVQNGKYTTPIIGNFRFFANYLGKKIMESVDSKNFKKVKTATIWKPSTDAPTQNNITEFIAAQEELKTYILNMEKWIKRDIIINSPANRNIVYPLTKALDIIIMHERRHFNQASKLIS